MVFYFYLSVLILILGAQIFLRSFCKAKLIFWLILLFQIFYSGYQIKNQYLIWQKEEATKFLIPPYQPINYFLFYSFGRIIFPFLISAVIALVFLFLSQHFNRRFEERFFYPEEPYLASTAILIVGHPLLIIYLASILITALLGTLITHHSSLSTRFSLYYLWIPLAIFSIIIGKLAVIGNWTWFLEFLSNWKIG